MTSAEIEMFNMHCSLNEISTQSKLVIFKLNMKQHFVGNEKVIIQRSYCLSCVHVMFKTETIVE